MPKETSPIPFGQIVLRGLYWMFGGHLSQAVSQVVVLTFLTKLLSPGQYGLMVAAVSVIGIFQIISMFGIAPAIVQHSNLDDKKVSGSAFMAVILAIFVYASLWFTAPLIDYLLALEGLEEVLKVCGVSILILSLGLIPEALLQRNLKFRQLAAINFASYVVGYGLTALTLAYHGWGVWALVYAHISQSAFKATLSCVAHPLRLIWNLHTILDVKDVLYFGSGFSLARIANAVAQQGDNLIIARFLGAEAVGLYGIAYKFLMLPTNLLGSAIDKVLFPVLSRIQNDKKRLTSAFFKATSILSLLVIPLSGLLFITSEIAINSVLGEAWSAAASPFQILALVLFFRIAYKISDALIRAMGAVYRRVVRQWIYALAVCMGAMIGSNWGLSGAAIGVGLAIVLNFLLMLELTVKLTGLAPLGLLSSFIRHLILGVAVVSISYAVMLLLIRTNVAWYVILFVICVMFFLSLLALLFSGPKVLGGMANEGVREIRKSIYRLWKG
jgi:O-antigen/teichoic acid export membrane protein